MKFKEKEMSTRKAGTYHQWVHGYLYSHESHLLHKDDGKMVRCYSLCHNPFLGYSSNSLIFLPKQK